MRCFHSVVLISLFLPVTLLSAAPHRPRNGAAAASERFDARVRVYNYARASPSVLDQAEEEATRIFASAGVRIEWVNLHEDALGKLACKLPFSPTDFILRILPRAMAARLNFSGTTLGVAINTREGKEGVVADVLYDNIKDLATSPDPSQAHLLALVAAHEIGHLLLPSTGHLSSGIMRSVWKPKDLLRDHSGYLMFTPNQSTLMRANLQRRIAQRGKKDSLPAPLNVEPQETGIASREENSVRFEPEPTKRSGN